MRPFSWARAIGFVLSKQFAAYSSPLNRPQLRARSLHLLFASSQQFAAKVRHSHFADQIVRCLQFAAYSLQPIVRCQQFAGQSRGRARRSKRAADSPRRTNVGQIHRFARSPAPSLTVSGGSHSLAPTDWLRRHRVSLARTLRPRRAARQCSQIKAHKLALRRLCLGAVSC